MAALRAFVTCLKTPPTAPGFSTTLQGDVTVVKSDNTVALSPISGSSLNGIEVPLEYGSTQISLRNSIKTFVDFFFPGDTVTMIWLYAGTL